MSDQMVYRYAEFVPPGLHSIADAAAMRGVPLVGILGNDDHTYGAHLSEVRLKATGRGNDYTLLPPPGTTYSRAGAGIDLGMGPEWMGEWLESVRLRCQTGEIGFVGELIGDPDLVPGPGMDAHVHLYASAAAGWTWVPYTGTGHVEWCHLWIRRDRLGDAGLGARLFDGWTNSGRVIGMSDADVAAAVTKGTATQAALKAMVEKQVRGMTFAIPGYEKEVLGTLLGRTRGHTDKDHVLNPADVLTPEVTAKLVAAVIAELKK